MTIAAIVVKPDGDVRMINLEPGYKAIQEVVGGCFDIVVSTTTETTFWVHDEGLLIGLEPNIVASNIMHSVNPAMAGQFLVGTVLITGGSDDEGETLGMSAEGMAAVGAELRKWDSKSFFEDIGL